MSLANVIIPSSKSPLALTGPAWISKLCEVSFDFQSSGVKKTTAMTCSLFGSLTCNGN